MFSREILNVFQRMIRKSWNVGYIPKFDKRHILDEGFDLKTFCELFPFAYATVVNKTRTFNIAPLLRKVKCETPECSEVQTLESSFDFWLLFYSLKHNTR